jgi:hypothetical protein
MSKLFNLNLKDLGGAVVSAIIVSILTYLSSLTSIYSVDVDQLINIAVMTAIASLLKALSTDENGKLGGVIKIK